MARRGCRHNWTPIEVMFFIASRTGMQVKRPGVGGEGFVLDHYDRPAIDNYLKNVGDRLLQGSKAIRRTRFFATV